MDQRMIERMTVTHGWPDQFDPRNPNTPRHLARLRSLAQTLLDNDPDLTEAECRHLAKVWGAKAASPVNPSMEVTTR